MARLKLGSSTILFLVWLQLVTDASVVRRTNESNKKVIRDGDQLFLVDAEEKKSDHSLDRGNPDKLFIPKDDQGREVIRMGDELIVLDDADSTKSDHQQKKRSIPKDDQGRRVIRIGDELIVVPDESEGDVGGSVGDGQHRGAGIHRRAAIKDQAYRWHDNTVPYVFDKSFGFEDRAIVQEAMDEWSRHTCVIFRPAVQSDTNRVKFVNGDGCYSFVGMIEKTQDISLDKEGCRDVSTALHEIGHALGMHHTQVRPDRDKFVKVNLKHVPDDVKDNFEKETWEDAHHYGVNYDYKSIMHYDETSFASNGGISIKTLNSKWQKIIGTAKHLSFGDIEMMNKMYKCVPKTCKLKDADCPGISFVDETCKCVCPGPSPKKPVVPCSGKGQTKIQPSPTPLIHTTDDDTTPMTTMTTDDMSPMTTTSEWDDWLGDEDSGDWDDEEVFFY